ncbi:MAG: MetQ/NlpA family ABC transporter substrate-binding protein [Coriobacteriia bacterium]|nr:MetQ/NlpA family ABC transporter substrate-binding protein [Coriobacteriia bacterium]
MKQKALRMAALVVALVLAATMLGGCGSKTPDTTGSNGSTTKTQTPATIKIGTLQTDDILAVWVALDKGLMKDQNLDVQVTTFQSAQEQIAAMTAGKIDAMMTDMVVPVQLNASGTPVKAVTACQTAPAGIIAGKGSGITQVSQLAGIPTGCSSPTAMEYIYDTALKNAGVAANQIKTTEIKKIPVRMQMLGAGQLKAAVLPWTLFSMAQQQGGTPLLDQKQAAPLTSTVLVFSQKFLDGDGADSALARFLAQYNKAVDAINAAPDSFRDLLIKEAKLPAAVASTYPMRQYPQAALPDQTQFESVVSWMQEKGYIKASQSYQDLTYKVDLSAQ